MRRHSARARLGRRGAAGGGAEERRAQGEGVGEVLAAGGDGHDAGCSEQRLRGEILLVGLRLLRLRLDAVQLRTRLADDIRHNAPQKLQHRGVAVTEKA